MRTSIALLAAALGLASANVGNFTFDLDINSVPLAERSQWCVGERNTCRVLCGGPSATNSNSCQEATLTYECTCKSNSSEPGLIYYDSSLYSQVCQRAFGQCNQENAGDAEKQDDCKTNIQAKCGTLKLNDPSSTGSAGSEPTETGSGGGGGGGGASTTTGTPGSAPTAFVGNAALAIGLLAALL